MATRTAEFRLTSDDMQHGFDLNGAIELEVLTDAQIKSAIQGDELAGLRRLYEENAAVQQMAGVPFLLNSMAYTYNGRPYMDLAPELATIPKRQQHLFDSYIEKRLTPLPHYYTLPQMKKWLGWLATKIGYYSTIFRREEISWHWSDDVRQKRSLLTLFLGTLVFFPTIAILYIIMVPLFPLENFVDIVLLGIAIFCLIIVFQAISLIIYILVLVLMLLKYQPFKLNRYLNHLQKNQILREIGGGYTFRHEGLRLSLLDKAVGTQTQIDVLIRDLQHWRTQDLAIKALSLYGENAVNSLIEAMRDDDWQIHTNAVKALTQIGEPAVEPLIAALYGDNKQVGSRRTTEALAQIGEPAVTSLIAALHDDNKQVGSRATEALVQIGKPAVASLIAALHDDSVQVRCRAADALGRIGNDHALKPLSKLADEHNILIHIHATIALARLGETNDLQRLIEALNDTDVHIRDAAAKALGQIGGPRAVKPLITALDDKDQTVRSSVAVALHSIGTIEALAALRLYKLKLRAWEAVSSPGRRRTTRRPRR